LKKSENVTLSFCFFFFWKKWQFFIPLEIYFSVISLVPSCSILIKLGSFDVFLFEMNVFSKKKYCSAL